MYVLIILYMLKHHPQGMTIVYIYQGCFKTLVVVALKVYTVPYLLEMDLWYSLNFLFALANVGEEGHSSDSLLWDWSSEIKILSLPD